MNKLTVVTNDFKFMRPVPETDNSRLHNYSHWRGGMPGKPVVRRGEAAALCAG